MIIEFNKRATSTMNVKYWRLNGLLHRTDGPAVLYADGSQSWFKNGKRHREDGPAIIGRNGTKSWYLKGKKYSFDEYVKKLFPNECKEKTVFLLKWSNK